MLCAKYRFVSIFFVCAIVCFCSCADEQLLSVVVIYRHGDRTPIRPYPKDPYQDESLWPVGFGQLTNLGKLHQFQLGQWLRARYENFLPSEYSEKNIYIRSTDVDRTLMSAEVNTAGLYPPEGQQVWDPNIPWQPVPIHTAPEKEDYLLAMKKPCRSYEEQFKELMNSQEMIELNEQLKDLYEYLTLNSGEEITDIKGIDYLYSTLFIEESNNFTLPDWTKSVYPDKLKPYAALSFAMQSNTTGLARLKNGPLLYLIQDHFRNISSGGNSPKFWVFSAHDTTIANVLNALGAFDIHCPPYMSLIIMELKQLADENVVVNLYYKNTTEPQKITLNGCEFDCPLNVFERILAPVTVSHDQWEMECNTFLNAFVLINSSTDMLLMYALGMVFFVGIGAIVALLCWRKNANVFYYRLPNGDVA